MKKRVISLMLVTLMVMCICGCKELPDSLSSDNVIIESETIIIDQNGNQITSSKEDAAASEDNVSSVISTPSDEAGDNTSSDNTSSTEIKIDYNKVVEIDICDDVVRGYLDATSVYNQYNWLSTYNGQRFDYQCVKLEWEIDESTSYTIYFSENADFSNAYVTQSNLTKEISNTVFVPGKTYYWKAVGNSTNKIVGGGKIKIKDAPVRWINIDGIRNVRDMGGWKTESGKTVKYEMLYRGAQLNAKKSDGTIVQNVKSNGLETFNSLGIKTEFDLRTDSDVGASAEGTNLNYIFIANHTAYHNIFSRSNKDTVVSNYKKIFETLSDKSNYPIYTHCQGGADRTGTYAFLLNGLLGVSYDDLVRDFEMTSFAGTKRWRSAGNGTVFGNGDADMVDGGVTVKWRDLYNGMMDYGKQNGCTTLQQSIEHWFINYIGIPQSQIDAFKSIMLE